MSVIESTQNEKRDFTRMKINSKVEIIHAGNTYQGICKNLSGAGGSIETGHHFDIGSELQLSIKPEIDKHQPFLAEALVTRVQAATNGKLLIGLSFKEIIT